MSTVWGPGLPSPWGRPDAAEGREGLAPDEAGLQAQKGLLGAGGSLEMPRGMAVSGKQRGAAAAGAFRWRRRALSGPLLQLKGQPERCCGGGSGSCRVLRAGGPGVVEAESLHLKGCLHYPKGPGSGMYNMKWQEAERRAARLRDDRAVRRLRP